MSNEECERVRALLAEHSDGELAAAEAGLVEAHLRTCAGCREELEALRRSLALARQVWRESVAGLERLRAARRRRRAAAAAAVAAACLILAVGAAVFWRLAGRRRPIASPPPAAVVMSEEDIERAIRRESVAAQLMASTRILAAQPGGEAQAEKMVQYVSREYADTLAAKQKPLPTTRNEGEIQ
jgi:predicted anti-sigma-YlaC factor YlaD